MMNVDDKARLLESQRLLLAALDRVVAATARGMRTEQLRATLYMQLGQADYLLYSMDRPLSRQERRLLRTATDNIRDALAANLAKLDQLLALPRRPAG